jgi:tartrate-resistant acid phosphatase type 5
MDRIPQRIALLATLTLGLLIPQGAGALPVADSADYRPTPAAQTRKIYLPTIRTPPNGSSIRFAVIGDYGSDSQAEADVASLVKSWDPSFVITVGDNNYPNGAASTIDANIGKYYYEFIAPYRGQYGSGAATNHFFPAMGNHEWDTPGAKPYLDYFTLPGNERYYDTTIGFVHFFMLDSDDHEPDGNTVTSKQGQWLHSKLAPSGACWDLVVMHHSPYSSGQHQGSSEWMQWPYQAWGADVVLSGHDHVYERIVLNNFPYFVNGLGGESLHPFASPVPGSQVRYNADFGAMLVDATKRQISFRFYSRAGALIDSYSRSKTCP